MPAITLEVTFKLLPTFALPVILAVPVIFAPVPVIIIVVLPAEAICTLPSAEGIVIPLVLFDSPPVTLPVTLPTNVVAINAPFAKLAEIAVLLCSG